jgi:hypothetical protein
MVSRCIDPFQANPQPTVNGKESGPLKDVPSSNIPVRKMHSVVDVVYDSVTAMQGWTSGFSSGNYGCVPPPVVRFRNELKLGLQYGVAHPVTT